MKKKILIFPVIAIFSLPFIARAVTLTNPLNSGSFGDLLTSIADWLRLIAIPIAVLMILVGAFQIMSSGGVPEKIKAGKQTILWTAVGYAIILVGSGITDILKQLLGAN